MFSNGRGLVFEKSVGRTGLGGGPRRPDPSHQTLLKVCLGSSSGPDVKKKKSVQSLVPDARTGQS